MPIIIPLAGCHSISVLRRLGFSATSAYLYSGCQGPGLSVLRLRSLSRRFPQLWGLKLLTRSHGNVSAALIGFCQDIHRSEKYRVPMRFSSNAGPGTPVLHYTGIGIALMTANEVCSNGNRLVILGVDQPKVRRLYLYPRTYSS